MKTFYCVVVEALTWFSNGVKLKTSLEAVYCKRFVLGAILFTNSNGDEKRSSSLAGMFSIALDSFSDSQNFFHVFKLLLVLY